MRGPAAKTGEPVAAVAQDSDGAGATLGGAYYRRCVEKALTLETPSLLRGVPLRGVLHRFAGVLSSSAGTAKDYDLSAPVARIDVFLSHTWSTSRLRKFLTLAIHYNVRSVIVIIAVLASGLSIVITAMEASELCSRLSYAALIMLFPLLLVSFHEVPRLFGRKETYVFLDKACVHQTDPELKRKGIQSLAAYLKHSRHMVVLYSDAYLGRLWTVYELAAFLLAHPTGRLEIVPVAMTNLVLANLGLFAASVLCTVICHEIHPTTLSLAWGDATAFPQSCGGVCVQRADSGECMLRFMDVWHFDCDVFWMGSALIVASVTHYWARMLRRIGSQLENFDIHAAECHCEDDRPSVESNVEAFVKCIDKVPACASKADALAVFNQLVRDVLPGRVRASLGPVGIPYDVALQIFIQMFALHFVWTKFEPIGVPASPFRAALHTAMRQAALQVLCFCVGPLMLAVSAPLASGLCHLEGPPAAAAWLTNAAVTGAVGRVMVLLMSMSYVKALHQPAAALAFLVYCCVLVLATYLVYSRSERWPRSRPSGEGGASDPDLGVEGP